MEIRASSHQVGNCISNTRLTILKGKGREDSKKDVEQSKDRVRKEVKNGHSRYAEETTG